MSAAFALPDRLVAEAAELVRRRTGMVIGEARRDAFVEALGHAMREAGVRDPVVYLADLAAVPALLDGLAGAITVGETYFFREPQQFEVLRERILPELLARLPPERRLRIWSAGCATGEEPYSIAILLHELGVLARARILATDISRPALARARRARYGRWSFRGVRDGVVGRYFTRDADRYELAPEIRSAVEFRYLNLAQPTYPSAECGIVAVDLIVCRNVLIYLGGEAIGQVTGRLVAALIEDGWLLLGASDPAIGGVAGCEVVMTPAGLVYRRSAMPAAEPACPPVLLWPAPIAAARVQAAPRPVPVEQRPVPAASKPVPIATAADGIAGVRALALRGELVEAERACVRALEGDGWSAELHVLHAQLLTEARRYEAATVAARRALYLDRSLAVAHLAHGAALAGGGNRAGARRAFAAAARLLAAVTEAAEVPASGGEPAGRLAELAHAELELLGEPVA